MKTKTAEYFQTAHIMGFFGTFPMDGNVVAYDNTDGNMHPIKCHQWDDDQWWLGCGEYDCVYGPMTITTAIKNNEPWLIREGVSNDHR